MPVEHVLINVEVCFNSWREETIYRKFLLIKLKKQIEAEAKKQRLQDEPELEEYD